jgi:hypothetical protein
MHIINRLYCLICNPAALSYDDLHRKSSSLENNRYSIILSILGFEVNVMYIFLEFYIQPWLPELNHKKKKKEKNYLVHIALKSDIPLSFFGGWGHAVA